MGGGGVISNVKIVKGNKINFQVSNTVPSLIQRLSFSLKNVDLKTIKCLGRVEML